MLTWDLFAHSAHRTGASVSNANQAPITAPRSVADTFYDNAVITVSPGRLAAYGFLAIPSAAMRFADLIGQVGDVFSGLKIGWVGTTADAAQTFNDTWRKLMIALFGDPDVDPSLPPASGTDILSQLAAAVATAATNFGMADQNIIDLFRSFLGDNGKRHTAQVATQPPPLPPSDILETGPGSG
jgi:hypothetical protein